MNGTFLAIDPMRAYCDEVDRLVRYLQDGDLAKAAENEDMPPCASAWLRASSSTCSASWAR